jgi:hypothetical protein
MELSIMAETEKLEYKEIVTDEIYTGVIAFLTASQEQI